MITAAATAADERRGLALVVLLALVVAAPSLGNGFAYDDRWIIVENTRVHALTHWRSWWTEAYWPRLAPDLYRPLTTTLFALQWAVGGGAPWVFHAVNITLHAAVTAAVWQLARHCVTPPLALVAAALFAVHPVHVEAVANGVGQAELSAGLCIVLAVSWYLRARRRPQGMTRGDVIGLTLLLTVGTLLKEHAIVVPLVWLIAECTLLRDQPRGDPARRTLLLASVLCVVVLVALRAAVLHSAGAPVPHPVLDGRSAPERGLIMLGVLPELVRVLLWPRRLHADYSPAHIDVSAALDPTQLHGVVLLVAWSLVLALSWRRAPVAAFALLWLAVAWAPTANLVIPSGVLLAERALYVPSVAVVLLLAAAWAAWSERRPTPRWPRLSGVLLGALLLAGVLRSVHRSAAWRSSETILWHLWREQPLSFKAHYAWGAVLFERGDVAGGIREWQMAIRILPDYHRMHQDLGYRLRDAGRCDLALPSFERAVALGGGLPLARAGVVACQLALSRYRVARDGADAALRAGLDPVWFGAQRRVADSMLVALDSLRPAPAAGAPAAPTPRR